MKDQDQQSSPGELPLAISLREVSRVFSSAETASGRGRRRFVALSSVSLDVAEGEFVALVGASGCGKTTILNLIAGLLQPSAGEIWVNGKKPRSPNLDIGYMFARDALLPWRTARRNVESSLEVRKDWPRARRQARALEMLDLVGLSDSSQLYRLQLSQGMRQRVALARTLAADPRILLMDEPFASVDARTRLQLQSQFLGIWEGAARSENKQKKTVVFVTHDLQEATLLADRVVVMLPGPGRVAVDRTVELPRPRSQLLNEVMFSDEFHSIHRQLFDRLEGSGIPPSSGLPDPAKAVR